VGASQGTKRETAHDGGGATQIETKGSVKLGTDGNVQAGYDASKTVTDKEGNSVATTKGVHADWKKGEVGASAGKTKTQVLKDEQGNVVLGEDGKPKTEVKSSTSASGNLKVNKDGSIEGANASITHQQGQHSLSVSGGVTVHADPPKQVDGKWLVSYKVE